MILDPTLTAAYVVLATALAVTPGPDVMFVVANGMQHKARGAVAAALGIGAGSLVHAIAVAVGVSALIASSPQAFRALQLVGAAYLAWLGFQALRGFFKNNSAAGLNTRSTGVSVRQVFMRGLITNIFNPKVIVFYLALLPQFVNVSLGHVGLQMFLLGSIHNVIGVVFLICAGLAAGRASGWLATTSLGRWLDAVAGVLFIGLALRLVFDRR